MLTCIGNGIFCGLSKYGYKRIMDLILLDHMYGSRPNRRKIYMRYIQIFMTDFTFSKYQHSKTTDPGYGVITGVGEVN